MFGRFDRRLILGVPVCSLAEEDFIAAVTAPQPAGDRPAFITYLNAACSNLAADDPEYRSILEQADCVYADGQAIVWAGSVLGQPLPARVNAGDFIIEFCKACAEAGLSLALIGGRPGVAAAAAQAWKTRVPGLQIVITQDGFFGERYEDVVTDIVSAQPDILLVGMGAPRQEKWAWHHRHQLGRRATWCVGALFEYYGEGRARAPIWMRRAGFEWMFRLGLEPRRLWKRYLVGNCRFVWRTLTAVTTRRPEP